MLPSGGNNGRPTMVWIGLSATWFVGIVALFLGVWSHCDSKKMLDSAQKDRELGVHPLVVFEGRPYASAYKIEKGKAVPLPPFPLVVRNVGLGVALNLRMVPAPALKATNKADYDTLASWKRSYLGVREEATVNLGNWSFVNTLEEEGLTIRYEDIYGSRWGTTWKAGNQAPDPPLY